MRPKSEIYTPKRDDKHPHRFHLQSPPHPHPPPGGTLLRALTPTFKFNACNCHLTLSLCIFINVDIIFTFRCVILLPSLIPFFPSVYFFDVPFLYFYLYTSYYLVYGTFICMANFSFQFLLLETSDIKLDFMESKLRSAV